jgi:hypothetical protein
MGKEKFKAMQAALKAHVDEKASNIKTGDVSSKNPTIEARPAVGPEIPSETLNNSTAELTPSVSSVTPSVPAAPPVDPATTVATANTEATAAPAPTATSLAASQSDTPLSPIEKKRNAELAELSRLLDEVEALAKQNNDLLKAYPEIAKSLEEKHKIYQSIIDLSTSFTSVYKKFKEKEKDPNARFDEEIRSLIDFKNAAQVISDNFYNQRIILASATTPTINVRPLPPIPTNNPNPTLNNQEAPSHPETPNTNPEAIATPSLNSNEIPPAANNQSMPTYPVPANFQTTIKEITERNLNTARNLEY